MNAYGGFSYLLKLDVLPENLTAFFPNATPEVDRNLLTNIYRIARVIEKCSINPPIFKFLKPTFKKLYHATMDWCNNCTTTEDFSSLDGMLTEFTDAVLNSNELNKIVHTKLFAAFYKIEEDFVKKAFTSKGMDVILGNDGATRLISIFDPEGTDTTPAEGKNTTPAEQTTKRPVQVPETSRNAARAAPPSSTDENNQARPTKPVKRPAKNTDLPTSNKYAALDPDVSIDEIEAADNRTEKPAQDAVIANSQIAVTMIAAADESDDAAPPAPKRKNLFRIFFECPDSYQTTMRAIMFLAPMAEAEMSGKLCRITIPDEDQFRKASNFITEQKIPFRTVDPRTEKPAKFLIRGLPATTDIKDIADALKELNMDPLKIAQLTNRKLGKKLPLFMFALRSTPANIALEQLKTINFMRIRISPFHTRGPAQCYQCQKYGHGSTTCNLTQACLLCSGPHRAKECSVRGKPELFRCANCGGSHAANSRDCPHHPANREKGRKRDDKQRRKDSTHPPTAGNHHVKEPTLPEPAANRNSADFVPAPLPSTSAWADRVEAAMTEEVNTPNEDVISPAPRQCKTMRRKLSIPAPISKHSIARDDASTQNEKSNSTGLTDLGELIKLIREFTSEFSISDIITMLRELLNILREPADPISKLTTVIEKVSLFFSVLS